MEIRRKEEQMFQHVWQTLYSVQINFICQYLRNKFWETQGFILPLLLWLTDEKMQRIMKIKEKQIFLEIASLSLVQYYLNC